MKDNFKKTIIGTNTEPPRNYIWAKNKKFYEYSNKWCECEGFKNFIPVETLELNKTKVSLKVKKTANLVANVIPGNSTDSVVTGISSDPDVVSVSCSGRITANNEGIAKVYAALGGKFAVCEVVVK